MVDAQLGGLGVDVESDEPMDRSPWDACPETGKHWCLCPACEPEDVVVSDLHVANLGTFIAQGVA